MNPSAGDIVVGRWAVARKYAVAAVSGGLSILAVLSGSAAAQDPISEVINSRGMSEWSSGFDAPATSAPQVRGVVPILSPETLTATQNAIQYYSGIVARGGWPLVPAEKKLSIGMRDPAVALLRQRLTISGDMTTSVGGADAFDSYVEAAVRRFQARHGIPVDGVVGSSTYAALNITAQARLGQLTRNVERLRELAASPPARYVMVNIPAAQIEAVEGGQVHSRHTAVVGKVDRPSPIINSKIYEINFNPFWTVPKSIIQRDLIPLMQKKPTYLSEQRIRIYDQRGNELSPQQVDWNTDEATNYMFRQDPGDFNSLGSVKINFYNKHAVYMHDTPNKTLFGDEYRFDSSGCVRVQNVRDLIVWLLRDTSGWSREQVDLMFRNGERLDVKLASPVPVYFAYFTGWSTQDGVVHFRNDIYLQDGLDQLALSENATVAPQPLAPQYEPPYLAQPQ